MYIQGIFKLQFVGKKQKILDNRERERGRGREREREGERERERESTADLESTFIVGSAVLPEFTAVKPWFCQARWCTMWDDCIILVNRMSRT